MSEPIKLKNVGEKHTMEVASCAKLTFGRYPEYEFTGGDGSVVRVPEAATLKQLGRLDLTPASVVGHRITIKRDKNTQDPSKPFWGLYLEEGNGSGPVSAGKAGAPTSGGSVATPLPHQPPAPSPSKPSELYEKVTDYVLATIVPKMKAAGVPVTHEGTSAQIATLFIAANNGGRH